MRSCFLLLAISALAGCNPYSCTYQTRYVATTVDGSGFSGFVQFRDYSGSGPSPRLVWSIEAATGIATPTSVVIADRRDGSVLATVAVQRNNDLIAMGDLTLTGAAERNRVYEVLSSGNGVLIVTTQAGPVSISLPVAERTDWRRDVCS